MVMPSSHSSLPATEITEAARLLAMGEIASAKARFERLAMTCPMDPSIQDSLGIIALRQRNLRDAEAYFKRATRLAPRDAGYTRHLATLYDAKGQPRAAMDACDQHLEAHPTPAVFIERVKRSLKAGDAGWLNEKAPALLKRSPTLQPSLNAFIGELKAQNRQDFLELLANMLPSSLNPES